MLSGMPSSRNLRAVLFSITILLTFLSCAPCVRTEDPSTDCKCELECLSSNLNRSSCPEGLVYQEKVALGGCCPACVKFLGIYEQCNDDPSKLQTCRDFIVENGIFVSKHCSPGLSCQYNDTTDSSICTPDQALCDAYHFLKDALWTPSCEVDGTFSPVQQKGDFLSGRWFCYSQDGKRIFGEAWRSNPVDMTCDLKAEVGNQYLRECESALVAAGRIKDILVKHGTNNTNLGVETCDPDGSYGSYQIVKDRITCTWKDKTTIGGYACPVDQLPIVNCNCARDTKLFEQYERPLYLTCGGNGNYNPKQVSDKKSFCVDSDGYPTTGLLDKVDCPPVA